MPDGCPGRGKLKAWLEKMAAGRVVIGDRELVLVYVLTPINDGSFERRAGAI